MNQLDCIMKTLDTHLRLLRVDTARRTSKMIAEAALGLRLLTGSCGILYPTCRFMGSYKVPLRFMGSCKWGYK